MSKVRKQRFILGFTVAAFLPIFLITGCSNRTQTGGVEGGGASNLISNLFDPVATPTSTPSFTVTVTATNASLSLPDESPQVVSGQTLQVPVIPEPYHTLVNTVSGTCPSGSWNNNTYTTGAITTDCTLELRALPLAQAIASGEKHNCVIMAGGLKCWGKNTYGQLGNDSTLQSTTPVPVPGLDSRVTAIAAGTNHTCAVKNGEAWCWGRNHLGQLGNGSTVDSLIPVQVSSLTGVSAISAGLNHSCAIANGRTYCWGVNAQRQLGDGTTNNSNIPVEATIVTPGGVAVTVTAGGYHSCATQTPNHTAQCWGWNISGQLGNLPGVTGVSAIAAGGNHSCAVVNGEARCWGANANGQTGSLAALGTGVTAIAAGSLHSCAIVGSGVWCWGSNSSGQSGGLVPAPLAYPNSMPNPNSIAGLAPAATAIAAGSAHTCAIVSGAVFCWGLNDLGQLGNSTNSLTLNPVPVRVQEIGE